MLISSNSSFIECVRKHNPSSHILLSPLLSNDCNQGCSDNDFGSTNLTLDDTSHHEFTRCYWTDCSSPDAGAITFRDKENSHLEINKCTFTRCVSNNEDKNCSGGAINSYNVHSISVTSSSFLSCSAPSRSGGGINLVSILYQPYIDTCTFISCFARDDCGGVEILISHAEDDLLICTDCQFINGLARGSDDPWAGGIILWDNSQPLKCSNSLFTGNTATYGGAYGTNYNSESPNYPLRFCFFHANQGTCGKDVCLKYPPDSYSTEYFLHCISTTGSNSVQNRTDSADLSIWLPKANTNDNLSGAGSIHAKKWMIEFFKRFLS